ncbi:hypothetical protein L3Q82_010526 [Scortum barcoo]|uniref:Uncharacterized protein n=1 Tax=Scortum barcoo TaxID=214431 RepID=A0ACB8WCH4_9TELE|nr:hypothetical protein L3Q82_010526 [Scortum barcoo]
MLEGYSPMTQALLGTLFTWGLTAAGAALVFVFSSRQKRILDGSLGFAAGVMLAASYWSLLAPAIDMAEDSGKYGSFAFLPVAVGFTLGAAFVYFADLAMPLLGVGTDPHTALAMPPGSKLAKEKAEDPSFQHSDSDEMTIRIGRAGPLSGKPPIVYPHRLFPLVLDSRKKKDIHIHSRMNGKTVAEALGALKIVFHSIVVSYYLKYLILSRYFDTSQQERSFVTFYQTNVGVTYKSFFQRDALPILSLVCKAFQARQALRAAFTGKSNLPAGVHILACYSHECGWFADQDDNSQQVQYNLTTLHFYWLSLKSMDAKSVYKIDNGDVHQRRRGPHSGSSDAQETGSKQQEGAGQTGSSWRRILLLILAITIHNIPGEKYGQGDETTAAEGLAVGVGFGAIGKTSSATFESARNLAIGIGIQNFPEGLAVSLPLRGSGVSTWTAFWYGQLSGMVEPLAGLLGAAIAVVLAEPLLPYALAFAAGAMVYVVVDDIIPEAQVSGNGKLASWTSILGFVVMMSLDVGLG